MVLLLSHLGKRSVVGFGGELGSVQKFSSHEQSEYPDLRERGHSFCPDLKEQQNLTNCEALRRNKKENILLRLRVPREIVLLWLLHLTPSESPLPVLVHARCPLSSACLFSFQEKAHMLLSPFLGRPQPDPSSVHPRFFQCAGVSPAPVADCRQALGTACALMKSRCWPAGLCQET